MKWDFLKAQEKFSELISRARNEGPQHVGEPGEGVVVISEEEYDRLTGKRMSFIEFLMSGPGLEGLDLSRDKSPMRNLDV